VFNPANPLAQADADTVVPFLQSIAKLFEAKCITVRVKKRDQSRIGASVLIQS